MVVIGGGVAGVTAAYYLQHKYDVTLIEQRQYVGGHTNTITIEDGPDAGMPVDTGFIVTNPLNYPYFQQFLRELNVSVRLSDMSFGYCDRRDGFTYGTAALTGLLARKRNLLSPKLWALLQGMLHLNKKSLNDLADGKMHGLSLGDYLTKAGYNRTVINFYLIPMGAAIWSTSPNEMLSYPAEAYFQFWKNHRLLQIFGRTIWQTVVGGSHAYIKAFLQQFPGKVEVGTPVQEIKRVVEGVEVLRKNGVCTTYDLAVIATHADEAYQLLSDPTPLEKELLGAWNYSRNITYLHTDISHLPRRKRAWASWNFIREQDASDQDPVAVTYHMNRLQGLKTAQEYCVTLNPRRPIKPELVIKEILYTHPHYNFSSLATQSRLQELNGVNKTWFCGSYHGYGFHEDAVRSSVVVAKSMGVDKTLNSSFETT